LRQDGDFLILSKKLRHMPGILPGQQVRRFLGVYFIYLGTGNEEK
jgi:hypothetical protein